MKPTEIDELVARKVMGWTDNLKSGGISDKSWFNESGEYLTRKDNFNPSYYIKDAWKVAEKLGLCLIPQSSPKGFRWLACDVEMVSYNGDNIVVKPLENTEHSANSAHMAICLAALLSVGETL
jgi:hypothetical protein